MSKAPFVITDQKRIDDICKIGQGSDCCRYLGAGANGFECFKHQAELRERVDFLAAVGRMHATSDNCEGIT